MRDRAYAKETAAYVREVYEHECSDWRILWILLYLDEEMAKNKSLKLLRIKEQFNRGMRSPVLYLEACQILNDQPMLLRTLNDFELSVLLYGCKERILDKRLVSQICELVVRIDGKFSMLYRLLTYLYYYNESDSVLESLCTLLIRNGCTGRKYINWYELAIERELKITKLFEYYIESCEKNIEAEIPKMVLLYFSYDSFISDETKAYLFANIIHHKDVNAQIYRNYIPQMEEFTAEMLSKGKNDACLGILYREFFKPGMVNPHNIKNASDALFSNLITCENKNIVKVIVGHKEAEFEESFDLLNQCAVVPVFTEEPCICFEDRYGKRYANSIDYSMEKICEGESFAKSVFELLGDEAAGLELLTLLYCDKHRRIADNSRNMLRFYYNLSQNEDIRASYRKKLLEMVVDYYYDNFEGNEKDDLIDNLDIAGLGENYMAKYTETLIVHGYALEAFEESKLVRCDKLNPKRVLRLCERLAEDYESMESEDKTQFIKLAYYAFSKGKYSETTLDILILDFNKSTEQMTALWKAAVEYGLNTYPLDERIIVQMLFTGAYSSASENVFEHYYQVGANERVMEAYLAYNAYNYFVREAVVSESVFDIIEARFEADKDVILVCRLAYLKYLSEKQELGVSQKELAKLLLKALSRKGYIFAFYQKFADKIKLPYEIADKTIIEYRAQPGVKAVLHYIEEGSGKNAYSTCDMKNMFEGIFVKDFVLFYGDALQYFVTEEIGDEREATTARRIENTFIKPEHSEGRYDAINDIIACRQLHDSQTLDHLIKMYGVAEAVTEQLFKPI